MNVETIRYIGLFIGLLGRLLLPAIIVKYNMPNFKWDHKYTKQFLIAAIISIFGVFYGYTPPDPTLTNSEILSHAIKDGVILEEIVNQFRKWDDVRIEKMLNDRLGGNT